MSGVVAPAGLGAGGAALWAEISSAHVLDAMQRVQLEEACRAKDRLDKLDRLLRGEVDVWARLVSEQAGDGYELKVDSALSQANATANLMKQLLAALRLPDEAGKRPQVRSARGVQAPSVPGGRGRPVSSLDRARAAKSGA